MWAMIHHDFTHKVMPEYLITNEPNKTLWIGDVINVMPSLDVTAQHVKQKVTSESDNLRWKNAF